MCLVREVGGKWEEGQKWRKNKKDVTSSVTLKKSLVAAISLPLSLLEA